MNKPLIRFARRLSSWESETGDDDLLQTEFWDRNRGQPDLRPSVYEIEPTDVVRAFAEHATAFNPPASSGGVDSETLAVRSRSPLGRQGSHSP